MRNILKGETWVIIVDGHTRTVDVIDAVTTPGWWTCRDRETGIQFAAREHWFVARLEMHEQ